MSSWVQSERRASDHRVDGRGMDWSLSERNESSGNIDIPAFLCGERLERVVLVDLPDPNPSTHARTYFTWGLGSRRNTMSAYCSMTIAFRMFREIRSCSE